MIPPRRRLPGAVATVLVAAVAAVAAAQESATPGSPDPDELLGKRVATAALVLLARPVGVHQGMHNGAFTGEFHVLLRSARVLKGILGPVNEVEIILPAADGERRRDVLDAPTRPDAPPRVFFLDEVSRFRNPPLCRLLEDPYPAERVADVERLVGAGIAKEIDALRGGDAASRDTAFKKLVNFGTPALPFLEDARSDDDPRAAEDARLAVNTIRALVVDPHVIVQPNRKYPEEPISAFSCPRCRDTLFRLPPGTVVFRLYTYEDMSRTVFRVRTSDGREGWVIADTCRKAPGESAAD